MELEKVWFYLHIPDDIDEVIYISCLLVSGFGNGLLSILSPDSYLLCLPVKSPIYKVIFETLNWCPCSPTQLKLSFVAKSPITGLYLVTQSEKNEIKVLSFHNTNWKCCHFLSLHCVLTLHCPSFQEPVYRKCYDLCFLWPSVIYLLLLRLLIHCFSSSHALLFSSPAAVTLSAITCLMKAHFSCMVMTFAVFVLIWQLFVAMLNLQRVSGNPQSV